MKIIEQFAHQGDTQWFSLDEIPPTARKSEKRFIAESERSGSCHALFGNYEMYEIVGRGFVIEAKEECVLNHSFVSGLKSLDKATILEKKDHRHTIIPKGIYAVGIQCRFDPTKGELLSVID